MSNNALIIPDNPQSDNSFHFEFNGIPFNAIIGNDGDPWFYATDVCKACEIDNVSQAVSRLDEDEKATIISNDTGRSHLMVNEPGLYALIGSSRKKTSKNFKRFVNHDVMPALRKRGTYSIKTLSPAEMLVAQAQQMLDHERRLERLEAESAAVPQLANKIADINNRLADSEFLSILLWCKTQNIKEGLQSVALRTKWGKECAEYSRTNGVPIKKALDEPHAPGRYHISVLSAVCKPRSSVPKRQLELPTGGK